MSRNIRALSARRSGKKTLFEILNESSKASGCLSKHQLKKISQNYAIPRAHLLATQSFYDFLNESNADKTSYVCNGTSCLMKASHDPASSALLDKVDDHVSGTVRCLGHCYHGGASLEQGRVTCIADENIDAAEIPYYKLSTVSMYVYEPDELEQFYRSVLLDPVTIREHLRDSKLRGRGGAGFLFATKLDACADALSSQKYLVCNADEGDPGAFSDRYLLENKPHYVLAGMLAAAHACEADTAYIYLRAEYPRAVEKMEQAIKEYEALNLDLSLPVKFHVIVGAGAYICGEETALLNSIEGLKPEVRTRPPYPAQQGLFDKPTLLSNVETFATLPWILNHSGSKFATVGTGKSTGTKLVCFDQGFSQPGVYEVTMGEPLKKIIYDAVGGFSVKAKAIQIGGPLGCIIPLHQIPQLNLDFESFDQQGFLLGHAGIVAIPESFPMIDFMRHLFEFMAQESCGKCLPCRLGTRKGSDMLQMANEENPLNAATFNELLETLHAASLCGLGSGLPLPIRNIMTYFYHELSDYFSGDLL